MYPKWRHYPLWRPAQSWVHEVVGVFASLESTISSETSHLESQQVLAEVRPALEGIGFVVEGEGKLPRPVLFGDEGQVVKSFNVDGYRETDQIAVEVEAGGAVYNNRISLDLLKMSLAVDVRFGVIAVPTRYATKTRQWTAPYPGAVKLFDALYANPERFSIPVEGLLLLGY